MLPSAITELRMIVNVHMLAFMNGEIRPVELPGEIVAFKSVLDEVFHYGQNDFCEDTELRQKCCSVSAGDVIELNNGEYWFIRMVGFKKMTQKEFDEYKAMSLEHRLNYRFKDLYIKG